MKMKRFPLVLAACTAIGLLSGCEFSVSTATIGSAVLARGYAGGNATGVTTAFHPSDNPLHLVLSVNNAPDGTALTVDWFMVNAGGAHNVKIASWQMLTTNAENSVDATLSNTHRWPTGSYKAVVYLNHKIDRTLTFPIR